MSDNQIKLQIEPDGLESLIICLALGTLKAIQSNALTEDAGIWCLARPKFWQPLKKRGLISSEIVEILQSADELSAIRELCGREKCQVVIAEAIAKLETRLQQLEEPHWNAIWKF
jgi:hypothetical protein